MAVRRFVCNSGTMDAEAWKRVRPVLVATLIPITAALGFFALATYAKKTPKIADRPSMAAFDACLSANGLQPQQSYQSQFDQSVAAQQEMKVCGSKIPPALLAKQQQQAEAAQSSFRDCVRGMAGSSGGFGRFRDRGNFRAAYAVCRKLIEGGQGAAPAKSPAKPVAPVA
jgi:hypothetical protein